MIRFVSTALALALAGTAYAAVDAQEAKALGTTLTPWGAEKAGNKEGTIPAYEGQVKIPASYDPKKPGVRPDPYAGERPLFSITAQNADKYADKLSPGVKELLRKYPSFRLDVYPSHRPFTYPDYVVDNTLKNATSCKTKLDGQALTGCYGGIPFPIPKNGNEVMWNHLVRYQTFSWAGDFNSWVVAPDGKQMLQAKNHSFQDSPFYNPTNKGIAPDNQVFWRIRTDLTEPARKVGEKLMVIDPLNWVNVGRRAYQYIPGQRRVKLAPDLAYDTPSPQGGGAATMDEAQLFLGATDRYDFKLEGKEEKYIPYNNFKAHDAAQCSDAVLLKARHLNPDCVRWELHRTWHVSATLKPGFRHIYPKRDFWFDEDAPGYGLADNYDSSHKLYRTTYTVSDPFYEMPGGFVQYCTVDLATGLYHYIPSATDYGGFYSVPPKPDAYYSPEALAAEGVR